MRVPAGLSDQLGQRARTNSEQLLTIVRPFGMWKHDPEQIHITPGSVSDHVGRVARPPQTSIEPVYYGVGSDVMAFLMTYHQHAAQKHPEVERLVKELIEHPSQRARSHETPGTGPSGKPLLLVHADIRHGHRIYTGRMYMLRSRHGSSRAPSAHIPVVEDFSRSVGEEDAR